MNTQEQKLEVANMSCGHCTMTVENTLKAIDGVISAAADKDTNSATVTYDPTRTNPEEFIAALNQTNYKASLPG